jgi:RHS repeat-associated protein
MDVAATATAITRYNHPDNLGSTNVTSDSSGNLAEWFDYAPYGSVLASENTGTTTAARQYIGQFADATGLSYLNSRYYNGSQGQFLSEDPIFLGTQQSLQNPQGLNSYSYSEDNPITQSDPAGRQCVACAGAEVGLSLSAQATYDGVFGPGSSAVYGGDVVAASIYGFAYPWTLVAPEPIAAVSAAAGNVAQQGLEYLNGDGNSFDPSQVETSATVASELSWHWVNCLFHLSRLVLSPNSWRLNWAREPFLM